MNSTPQLPSKDDPHHPLNLLPIPELKADLSNFTQWRHALWFHLQYNRLAQYANITMREPSTEEERQIQEMHSMHAYSLIAAKIENIAPLFEEVMGRELFHDRWHTLHFSPAQLWADILELWHTTRDPGV